jgi:hypothetical protein
MVTYAAVVKHARDLGYRLDTTYQAESGGLYWLVSTFNWMTTDRGRIWQGRGKAETAEGEGK